jgi:hypothetical protein
MLLALSGLVAPVAGFVAQPPAGLLPKQLQPALRRCEAAPVCQLAAPTPSLPSISALAVDVDVTDTAVVTDTLLDLAVYGLLFGVAALTLYSIVVTLQASNDQYGGWTKQDDEDVMSGSLDQPTSRLQSGARYDPTTDTWTYPTPEEQAAKAKVGRAPSAASQADEATNRYDRRMAKKRKAAQKRGGKKK